MKKSPPAKVTPSEEKGWVKAYGYWWPPQQQQFGREVRMVRYPQWRIEMLCYWGCVGQVKEGGVVPKKHSEGAEMHLRRFIDEIWNWEGSPVKFLWTPMAEEMLHDCMEHKRVSLAGSASSGKSQFGAIWALANFLISCHNTKVFITSTTLDESRQRIWGVIERYWHAAATFMEMQGYPMPGKLTSSRGFITGILDGKPSKLVGLALLAGGKGQDKKAATKIGFKSPRMFIVADELPVLTTEFSESLANLSSNKNVHMIGIGNPKSYLDPFGLFSEPVDGWSSITENDYYWLTKEGGCCRRFNAERSPNYLARKEIWPGLATYEYVESMKAKYGEDSPDYWRYVKAYWSPTGDKGCIYCEKEIYDSGANLRVTTPVDIPKKLAFLDPAWTTGGDRAVVAFGSCGLYENKLAGRTQKYLQIDEFVDLKKKVRIGDDMTKRIIELYKEECESRGIPLKHRGVDVTGGGIPFASFMAEKMGRGFVEVCFGGKPSHRTMSRTDLAKGPERYKNRVTELWYGGKELLRGGNLKGLTNPDCITEMCARTSERVEKEELQVEPKSKMKSRAAGRSPDYADSLFGLIEIARQVCGLSSDARAAKVPRPQNKQEDQDFSQFTQKRRTLPPMPKLKQGGGPSWGLTGSFKRAQMFGMRGYSR